MLPTSEIGPTRSVIPVSGPVPVARQKVFSQHSLPGTFVNSFFKDERGKWSIARAWLTIWLVLGVTMMWRALFRNVHLQNVEWNTWGATAMWLAIAVFGPRVGQYLGPQLGAIVQGIGQSVRDPRLPSRTDREEGP